MPSATVAARRAAILVEVLVEALVMQVCPGLGGQSVCCAQAKAVGVGRAAALRAEYEKVHEAGRAEQPERGVASGRGTACRPDGSPRMVSGAEGEDRVGAETPCSVSGGGQR